MQSRNNLAPIAVSTYSRINHLKQTIEALQKNTLAKESELYIFSDASQQGDEEIVAKVRDYIDTIDGFKEVHIIKRETNGRVANNRGGISRVLKEYGKIIFLEDDNITSPYFLEYMNNALEYYKDNDNIMSISGQLDNISIPKTYKYDTFFGHRFNGWGMGIWEKEYNLILNKPNYNSLYNLMNNVQFKNNIEFAGDDVYPMIVADSLGKIDALDVKGCFYLALYNKYTVYPIRSLVKNIGMDGSGTHCQEVEDTSKYDGSYDENFQVHKFQNIYNPEIAYIFKNFYRYGMLKKLKLNIKNILKIILRR